MAGRRYPPELRERAVRMVLEHQQEYESQWAAISSIAEKIGCTKETLRTWVRRAERDGGKRPGVIRARSASNRVVWTIAGSHPWMLRQQSSQ